ncbi:DUF4876 domain-containing protein [Prevotella sp. E2-28]|uniref:DUF4876 domain-containing protein n=1 Tax=Prevotella sp. E2-28 TaxID=2913620 RepID=UPI001EDA6CFA|nr:DUF4876 domain-containing protein [Prevotella sp. E2-28]UKK53018.1 DUF4876 domain-containing protein [Prevotella sp. E2-28]
MIRRLYILLVACGLFALNSCVDFSDATGETSARVQLLMPKEFTGNSTFAGHEVILQQGSTRISATTDANGVATFNGLIPDVYDISCSWELTEAEYHQATGSNQAVSGCTVSGSQNSLLIKEEQTISLSTQLSINQDIIISKIYYAGSKDNNNRNYMAGKYIEIYNQSNKAIDVAGFYIGLVEAESTQAYTLDNLHEAYADSVVLLKQIFRIPATTSHKVAAGGSVLIVNSAIDHTANNTSMESDLSNADFEAKDYSSNPVQNNPATPALELIYTMYPSISNLNLVQSGPCGVVLFHTDEDVSALPTTYAFGKTSGNQWKLLPKRMILDAVEVLSNKATGIDVKTKRLYDDLDAGYTYINSASGRNGEVVYRKTSKKADDGRITLMDTNNSSNDFQVSLTIKPREYDE